LLEPGPSAACSVQIGPKASNRQWWQRGGARPDEQDYCVHRPLAMGVLSGPKFFVHASGSHPKPENSARAKPNGPNGCFKSFARVVTHSVSTVRPGRSRGARWLSAAGSAARLLSTSTLAALILCLILPGTFNLSLHNTVFSAKVLLICRPLYLPSSFTFFGFQLPAPQCTRVLRICPASPVERLLPP
jgi:hypothetical protein